MTYNIVTSFKDCSKSFVYLKVHCREAMDISIKILIYRLPAVSDNRKEIADKIIKGKRVNPPHSYRSYSYGIPLQVIFRYIGLSILRLPWDFRNQRRSKNSLAGVSLGIW